MSECEYGSQLWMQIYANYKNAFDELNKNAFYVTTTAKDFNKRFILNQKDLIWLSPLKKKSYEEYGLKEQNFWHYLQEYNDKNSKEQISLPFNQPIIKDIWGKDFSGKYVTSPKWDGIALSADRKTLYLFEAKANIDEITANGKGYKVIPIANQCVIYDLYNMLKGSWKFSIDYNKFINAVCVKGFSGTKLSCENCPSIYYKKIDKKCHYQILNRLWFFDMIRYYINKYKDDNNIGNVIDNVQLVFLEFCNDHTNKPTTKEEFHKEYFEKNSKNKKINYGIWAELIGKWGLPNEDISVIYLDVDKISKAYNKANLCLGCHKKDTKNSIIKANAIKRKNEIITTKFW